MASMVAWTFVAGLTLSLLGCESAPPGAATKDPVEVPLRTPSELFTMEPPAGLRLGDVLTGTVNGVRQRDCRDPNPATYFVATFGRSDRAEPDRAEIVQWCFPAEQQLPVADFVAAAGIALAAPVAAVRVPETRNRMRMSQTHIQGVRYPAVLVATDRAPRHLLIRNGKVDSVVWVEDLAALPAIEARSLAELFAVVEAGIAGEQMSMAREALAWVVACMREPGLSATRAAPLQARVVQLEQQFAAAVTVHDAPFLAEHEQQLAVLRRTWPTMSGLQCVRSWHETSRSLAALRARMVAPPADPAAELRPLFTAAAWRSADPKKTSAVEQNFWQRIAMAKDLPDTERILAGVTWLTKFNDVADYRKAMELKPQMLDYVAAEIAQRGVIAAVARQSAALAAQGEQDAALYLQHLIDGGLKSLPSIPIDPEFVDSVLQWHRRYQAARTDADVEAAFDRLEYEIQAVPGLQSAHARHHLAGLRKRKNQREPAPAGRAPRDR